MLGIALLAIGAFIAFACLVVLAFAITIATVTVAAATTTAATRLIAFACQVLRFAFRTGVRRGFQDAGGFGFRTGGRGQDRRSESARGGGGRYGGRCNSRCCDANCGRAQCQLFDFHFCRRLVATRFAWWTWRAFRTFATLWTLAAFRTLTTLGTFRAFRALATFSTFARWLAFGLHAIAAFAWFAAFTRFAWRTWWTGRAAAVGCLGLVGDWTGGARFALFALRTAILAGAGAAARATGGVAVGITVRRRRLDHDGRLLRQDRFYGLRAQEAHQLGKETFWRRCRHGRRGWRDDGFGRLAFDQRCRLVRSDGLDHGFLARLGFFLLALAVGHVGFGFFGQVVAGLAVFEARVVVLDALELVVWRVEVLVRDQDHGNAVTVLDFQHFTAFFVEQERCHIDRHLHVDGGRVFLHCLFLDDAQDLQGRRFGITDVAGAGAARAGHVGAFRQRRTQALARQFHQAEARNLAHLDAGAVMVQRVFQALFDFALVLGHFHVDEVDHDQAAQIAQAQLARHFVGRFAVGVEGGRFDVRAARGAGRVDVDRNQRFGVVDHDGAARWQRHGARVGGFDLVFDLETREQRHVVAVTLHAVRHVGHHVAHELLRLFIDFVGVDQHFADVRLEVIADRADDERRFLIDQERAVGRLAGAFDRAPQLHQVVQVPLQFIDVAADAGGAGDHRHAWRQVELVHGFAQFLALFTFDAARHTTTARVVRHQHQVAAGQRDERGQGGALVAALFLFDLDHDFLAFAQRFLDGRVTDIDAFLEVSARNFLEWQETVAIFTVADEARFERWFDAGDHALVDIGLALFASGGFDIDIDQFLTIDNRYAQLFLLRSIKQHAFHFY